MSDFPTNGTNVVDFIETFLTLGGSYRGQPFDVMPWMSEVIDDIYRTDEAGKRLHRTYLLGVPRKNGKSILGAAIALYQLIADPADEAPQVIGAAGDRKQARLVFDEAKRMVLDSPELRSVCRVMANEIQSTHNGGVYRVVSADAGRSHGLNPSTVIVDEYHVFKNRQLFDALTTGSGARNEPLTLVISTAGYDLSGPLGQLYEYGRRIESGELEDASFGFKWYGVKDGEVLDPRDPVSWRKTNPSFDFIMSEDEFASQALQMPESEFIRFRMNGWTATQESWFGTGKWDALSNLDAPIMPGDELLLGFDGSIHRDSTALVAIRLSDMHIQPIGVWEAPPGDPHWIVPHLEVLEAIREACEVYNVREVSADPSRWEFPLQELEDEGYPIMALNNSRDTMVKATQAFHDAVIFGNITHNGDPVLARHISNVVLKMSESGARITKLNKSSDKHIDVAVAAVMAHYRAKQYREVSEPQLIIL